MGGMVLETNMSEILTHIEAQNKLEKSEVRYIEILITYCMKRYDSIKLVYVLTV
jgi:hypothetical protein